MCFSVALDGVMAAALASRRSGRCGTTRIMSRPVVPRGGKAVRCVVRPKAFSLRRRWHRASHASPMTDEVVFRSCICLTEAAARPRIPSSASPRSAPSPQGEGVALFQRVESRKAGGSAAHHLIRLASLGTFPSRGRRCSVSAGGIAKGRRIRGTPPHPSPVCALVTPSPQGEGVLLRLSSQFRVFSGRTVSFSYSVAK